MAKDSQDNQHPNTFSPHKSFATSLDLALGPVDLEVYSEVEVMTNPPKADILIICKAEGEMTAAQQARLCDGLRDSTARWILIEFKYTESVSAVSIKKAIGYRIFFMGSHQGRVEIYIISSKTPSGLIIDELEYRESQPGILRSSHPLVDDIPIISLNDLPDTPHNIIFKLFASKSKQKLNAFGKIDQVISPWSLPQLEDELCRLGDYLLQKEGFMSVQATKSGGFERINQLLIELYKQRVPKEIRLSQFSDEELLEHIPKEKRVEDLSIDFLEQVIKEKRQQQG